MKIIIATFLLSIVTAIRAEEKAITNAPAPPRAAGKPVTLVLTNQIVDPAARRIALVRQVNEYWTVNRRTVVQEVEFKQTAPISFGQQGGVMDIFCSLIEKRNLPDHVIVHFHRTGPTARWDDYHPVVVNAAGQLRSVTTQPVVLSYHGDGVLEQMGAIIKLEEFRDWARQTELGFSVADEEFILTEHTLNKWRTLLAYFDMNESHRATSK